MRRWKKLDTNPLLDLILPVALRIINTFTFHKFSFFPTLFFLQKKKIVFFPFSFSFFPRFFLTSSFFIYLFISIFFPIWWSHPDDVGARLHTIIVKNLAMGTQSSLSIPCAPTRTYGILIRGWEGRRREKRNWIAKTWELYANVTTAFPLAYTNCGRTRQKHGVFFFYFLFSLLFLPGGRTLLSNSI